MPGLLLLEFRHLAAADLGRKGTARLERAAGIASLNDGTVPAISANRGACATSSVAPRRGTEFSSPLV
jgi:hypothetical protein